MPRSRKQTGHPPDGLPPQPVPSPTSLPPDWQDTVDELGRVERELLPHLPLLKRREKLRETVQAWFRAADPVQEIELERPTVLVKLSARAKERHVDLKRLHRVMKDKIWSCVKAVVTKLEAEVEDLDSYTTHQHTGSRVMTVEQKY